MTCDAKMRPFPSEVEVVCELDDQGHMEHVGVVRDYAYPGSQTRVEWFDGDRRTFHGDWPGECDGERCVLPRGRRGEHVV